MIQTPLLILVAFVLVGLDAVVLRVVRARHRRASELIASSHVSNCLANALALSMHSHIAAAKF